MFRVLILLICHAWVWTKIKLDSSCTAVINHFHFAELAELHIAAIPHVDACHSNRRVFVIDDVDESSQHYSVVHTVCFAAPKWPEKQLVQL